MKSNAVRRAACRRRCRASSSKSVMIVQGHDKHNTFHAISTSNMTRRSGRLSGTGTATGKHKRAASGSSAADLVPKKAKKQHATPTKSQYFESNDEDPADSNEVSDSSSAADSGSDFADPEHEEDAISGPAQSAEDDEDEEDEENENSEADRPRSKKLSKMRPGTQVIFKKPKARPAGKVPYTDETIHPNTLLFLADLKANNKREWLKGE